MLDVPPLFDIGICDTCATAAMPGTARSTWSSRLIEASICSGVSWFR